MKRTLIILGFVLIIVLLFGAWVYSLLYGTPQRASDVFANFGWGGGDVTPFPEYVEPIIETPLVNIEGAALRQLTTKPVIAYSEVTRTTNGTSTPTVRYVEAGTGHVFDINLRTGEETRVSNITVPTAHHAAFSPNGQLVAIRAGHVITSEVVVVDLKDLNSPSSIALPYRILDFAFSNNDELYFTEETRLGQTAWSYDLATRETRQLFTIPFFDATVRWSTASNSPHYVYTKPAARLWGYAYEIVGNTIRRLPIAGIGLTAAANAEFITYTKLTDTETTGHIYRTDTNQTTNSPILTLPEKCVSSRLNPELLYCGHEITTYGYTFPDEWYKGTRSFNDSVWLVNLATRSAVQLVNPFTTVGFEIDIINPILNRTEQMLYFTNKNDKTLWVYEL